MRALGVALALIVSSAVSIAHAALPGEQVKAGFVFANAGAALRETPDAAAKSVGTPPSGLRLVYRRLIDTGTGPSWYFVEHPGGKSGWIAAKDTTTTRPTTPPPAKPIKIVDSGIGVAQPSSAQTAAARGLSPAAKGYAEKKQDWKSSVDQFITMEATVDEYFADPHDAEGNYPDETRPGRKQKAEAFRADLK
jgi:hypothetical protein